MNFFRHAAPLIGILLYLPIFSAMATSNTAATSTIDPDNIVCADDPASWDGPQIELTLCAGKRLDKFDQEMNKAYQEQTLYLQSKDSKTQFAKSQEAWLEYRKFTCLYESWPVHGGSLEPELDALCMANLTAERVKHLKDYLACRDNGCPF